MNKSGRFSCLEAKLLKHCVLAWSVALCAAVAGCSESIRQYSAIEGWKHSDPEPVILSGDPQRDAAAYQAGQEVISAAQWDILEKIAPRPIWEKVAKLARVPPIQASPATQPSQPITTSPAYEIPDIPAVRLPDGQVQFCYQLRNYGGSSVKTSYDKGTDRRRLQLTEANLQPLLTIINNHLGKQGRASALPSENTIVITCQPSAKQGVLELLGRLDTPRRQVEITARIFEVAEDFDFKLGARALLKHIASDNTQAVASAFSIKDFLDAVIDPATGQVADPGSALQLIQVFGSSGISLDVTLQALAENGLIRMVAEPRMTVSAGQTAYMLAGQELPIQSAKISNDKIVTEEISYKPIGVQLYISPQTVAAESVKLHVLTVVSAISGFSPLPSMNGSGSSEAVVNPILDSREAETYVTVKDGNVLVIGGLRLARTITREQKIPGLGDMPLVGWFFKNHRSQRRLNDLYFFVTPKILPQ